MDHRFLITVNTSKWEATNKGTAQEDEFEVLYANLQRCLEENLENLDMSVQDATVYISKLTIEQL